MSNIHLRKLLRMYCLGQAGIEGNVWVDRLTGKATITSGLCLGKSEVLRSLRHYMWAQRHCTIGHQEKRGIERGNAWWSSLRGRERAIANQTNPGTVSEAMVGKQLRDGVEPMRDFLSKRTPPWTEVKRKPDLVSRHTVISNSDLQWHCWQPCPIPVPSP